MESNTFALPTGRSCPASPPETRWPPASSSGNAQPTSSKPNTRCEVVPRNGSARQSQPRCTNPALLLALDAPHQSPPPHPTTPREGTHDNESDGPTHDWTRHRNRRRRRQMAFIDRRAAGGLGATTTRKIDMTRSDPSTSSAPDPTTFSVVDNTADPDFYVRFT